MELRWCKTAKESDVYVANISQINQISRIRTVHLPINYYRSFYGLQPSLCMQQTNSLVLIHGKETELDNNYKGFHKYQIQSQ